MSAQHPLPTFTLEAPRPLHELTAGRARVCVYPDAEQMGLATAVNIASHQVRLVAERGTTSLMLMAAPSAFGFYQAYQNLVSASQALQAALFETHLFQFDDYPLPQHHPVSFRFLLQERFLAPIARFCDASKIHFLQADAPDAEQACRRYGEAVLAAGPDLQVKGAGEDGHWGFHQPGIPIDDAPKLIRVTMSEANIAQQMRDHPKLFPVPDSVPKYAYTANVPLFMRTRELIEDNIPQPSKAFAVLAAYANDTVKDRVPTSALKGHPSAVIRLTSASAWALLEYRERQVVTDDMIRRLDVSLSGADARGIGRSIEMIRGTLAEMKIPIAD